MGSLPASSHAAERAATSSAWTVPVWTATRAPQAVVGVTPETFGSRAAHCVPVSKKVTKPSSAALSGVTVMDAAATSTSPPGTLRSTWSNGASNHSTSSPSSSATASTSSTSNPVSSPRWTDWNSTVERSSAGGNVGSVATTSVPTSAMSCGTLSATSSSSALEHPLRISADAAVRSIHSRVLAMP